MRLVEALRQNKLQVTAVGRGRGGISQNCPHPQQSRDCWSCRCPCFYTCHPQGISCAFCKMVPCTKFEVREQSGCSPRVSALCNGAAALLCETTLEVKPHPSWGSPCRTLYICAYIYIYICNLMSGCSSATLAVLQQCRQLGGVQAGAGRVWDPRGSQDASGRGCCSTVAEAMPDAKLSLHVFGVKQLSPSCELGLIWAGKSIRATP